MEQNARTLAERLELALAFDMDNVLRRYCRDYDIPMELAKEHEKELKRYLVLCVCNTESALGMHGPIDALWHTFLIFTRDYAAFCTAIKSPFIHHSPVLEGDSVGTGTKNYHQFLKAYADAYHEEPPKHYWPRFHDQVDYVACHGGGGGGSCGGVSCHAQPH